jgi:hypothetical protein
MTNYSNAAIGIPGIERAPGARSLRGLLPVLAVSAALLLIVIGIGSGAAPAQPGVAAPTSPTGRPLVAADWVLPVEVLLGLEILFIVLLDLRYGLALFLLATGLSPKVALLGYNNFRIEDGIFGAVFLVWLGKCLVTRRVPRAYSPLTLPVIALTAIGAVSAALGSSTGAIQDPSYSVLMQLKRVEYFLILVVVATDIRTESWLRSLVIVFVFSGALTAVYGFAHQQDTGYLSYAQRRLGGPSGENYNMLSGYLVVCISLGIAAFAEFRDSPWRYPLLIGVMVMISGVLWSFSREGTLMLIGAFLVLFGSRHRIIGITLLCLILPALLTGPVRQHFEEIVDKIQNAQTADRGQNSLTDRLVGWQQAWDRLIVKQPLIGNGPGCIAPSVDNEYVLRACEGGLIGFLFFLWTLFGVRREVRALAKNRSDPLSRLLATALLASFVGLLIQGLAAASFTAIRAMEAFWFLLGMGGSALLLQRRRHLAAAAQAAAYAQPSLGPAWQPIR